jgi:hypothetical protein
MKKGKTKAVNFGGGSYLIINDKGEATGFWDCLKGGKK